MDRTLDFFHPVLPAKELRRKPVRVLIAGTPFVLFRDHTRKAQGLIDRCPHRHAPLSAGWVRPDGRLACQYHGWNFDGAGCGRSPTIVDLNCQVPHLAVVERQDFIWIAGPHVSPDTIPGAESPDFHFAGGFSELFPAPLHVALDNFSEDEHTPFIHHRLGWTPEQATQVEFESKNFSDHCEVHYRAPQRVNLVYVRRGDQFNNHWRTYYDPPRIHYHLSWTDPSGTKLRPFEIFVLIYFVPETDRTTRVQSILYVKHEGVFQFLRPLTKKAAVWMVQKEVRDDARFMPVVANTPFEMHGMKLGKFDKPLVQNHKLLKKIYWGEPDEPATSNPDTTS